MSSVRGGLEARLIETNNLFGTMNGHSLLQRERVCIEEVLCAEEAKRPK